ncbi:MAG: hypothetical protein RLZZ367_2022 [Bacteroidota bacterium]|jgi:hypothetical protein
MNEKLLHFIWQFRLFNATNLTTTTGDAVEVIKTGTLNSDAGPDFTNAKIRIGQTLWAGNVELHINANDWYTHKHQHDAAYNNVVLHVVYEAGIRTANNAKGEPIPTIELKGRINPNTLARYEELSKNRAWIPCAGYLKEAGEFTLKNFEERLLIERLESKVEYINELLTASGNDWENVMFQLLARYFGASINKEPFFLLAKSLPVKVWAKYQDDILQLEALLFGQAGFLEDKHDDEYPNQLRKEYLYLKRLHGLQPLQKHQWKLLRLRPSNFPTLRIAQLAALLGKNAKLFSQVLNARNTKTIHQLLDVEVSPYWQSHYQFDRPSKKVNHHIGADMKNTLLINAVAPVLFAYGKYKDNEEPCDRALELLQQCNAESNSIITGWGKLGVKAASAYETQALLQLKTTYCDKFRCLECGVGIKILK